MLILFSSLKGKMSKGLPRVNLEFFPIKGMSSFSSWWGWTSRDTSRHFPFGFQKEVLIKQKMGNYDIPVLRFRSRGQDSVDHRVQVTIHQVTIITRIKMSGLIRTEAKNNIFCWHSMKTIKGIPLKIYSTNTQDRNRKWRKRNSSSWCP